MGRDLKLKLLIRLKDYIHLIIKRTMSKIYKIEFNDCVYFGSTKLKLIERQYQHNSRLKNRPTTRLYKEAIKNGIEKLECVLVCECSNEERYLKENEFIKNTTDKILLNTNLAIEDKEKTKEKKRQYYQTDQGKEIRRIYHQSERVKEYRKEYDKTERAKELKRECAKRNYEKHKEQIKEKQRQYYQKQKQKKSQEHGK